MKVNRYVHMRYPGFLVQLSLQNALSFGKSIGIFKGVHILIFVCFSHVFTTRNLVKNVTSLGIAGWQGKKFQAWLRHIYVHMQILLDQYMLQRNAQICEVAQEKNVGTNVEGNLCTWLSKILTGLLLNCLLSEISFLWFTVCFHL